MDAHFDPLPPPYSLTSEEYYERREVGYVLWHRDCWLAECRLGP